MVMYVVMLYFMLISWLDEILSLDGGYGKTVFWLFLLLAFVTWVSRKKWKAWLLGRYQALGIIVSDKKFPSVVGDIVWLGLELFFIIFVFVVPGALQKTLPVINADLIFVIVNIVLCTLTLCDTQLDVVLTGERRLPSVFLRSMPVTMAASAGMAVYYLRPDRIGAESRLPCYLLELFLAEVLLNLTVRTAVQRKREKTDTGLKTDTGRNLKLSAWVVIGVLLVEAFPLMPLLDDRAGWGPVLFIFMIQTACLLFFFGKRNVWAFWIQKKPVLLSNGEYMESEDIVDSAVFAVLILCWLVFGNILPDLLFPWQGRISMAFFCVIYPAFYLLTACLSDPFYKVLTGTEELPGVGRRIPYVTLAACLYAVVKIPMPWTDVRPLASLAALGLLELFFMLSLQRIHMEKQGKTVKSVGKQ